MPRLLPLALALAALVVAGCGSDDEGDGGPDAAATATTQEAPAPEQAQATETDEQAEAEATGTTIRLGDSQFGQVIFDQAGQAIYLFDKETTDESQCYDECAEEWPPVLTEGEPQVGGGLEESLLGTTERDDGTTQVTYNGHPLYYYAHEGRDEVRCHDVPGFGGVWYALDADGDVAGS